MKLPVTGQTRDIIAGSAATLALFLAYVLLPLAGMVAGLLAPLPGAFYSLKSGRMTGIAIVVITTAVLAVVADPASTVLYLLESAIISLALPFFLQREFGGTRAIIATVVLNMSVVVITVAAYGVIEGVDVHGLVQKGIDASISQTAALYEKGGVKGEELQTFQQAMRQAGAVIGRIYPALVAVALATIAGVTLAVLGRLGGRLPRPLVLGDFKEFKNQDHLVWALIAAGFAVLVPNNLVSITAVNLLIVLLSLYFVQGLAIVSFYFYRFGTPKFLRALFYLFLALQPYITVAVAVLGIFDLWGNFRVPKKT